MRGRSLVAKNPSNTMAARSPPEIIFFTLRFMFPPAATVSNAQAARAIANAIPLDSEVFEQRQMQVCQRSEEHTSELQSQSNLVCRLLLEKKNSSSRPALEKPSSRENLPNSCSAIA